MNNIDENKLDNPVWNSLSEEHEKFCIDYNGVKFYNPDYCPFGGFINLEETEKATGAYAALSENFFVVGEKPKISSSLKIVRELVCLQMIIHEKIQLKIDNEIIKLTDDYKHELLDLVNLVQPGYFKPKTTSLGNYYGIFVDQKLVAVAGERMKMNDFTEVSAIITHPDYTGKGYAKQLTAYVANQIFTENKTPFLHVVESNIGAIKLYEKLGFVTRRKMSFWNITKYED
ncbi:GNAT family N-acetyltransferase [Flavobacterium sp. SORGH_AS_0622]|jgi:ribosomal protein S18 acetylase RimI-like enzyme|uniref:GNAT family N-acetyltransferase n=1 Tax=Flavobacterium sp. SORGH_AS_0622 TaxID=3041772 RepID=UPI002782E254|nr:GNAT family N-acetyltransferase [Flavobacterium sp. SORGH_AS_0622]MDQ1164732.1 ribosomal protein S18 acetylase RimI-like enzyme [Flavobacterium sp. SORGH_AS_0622]